jgi:hypothetical protein
MQSICPLNYNSLPIVCHTRLCGGGDGKSALCAVSPISTDDNKEVEVHSTTRPDLFVEEDYIGVGLTWKDPMDKKVVYARNKAMHVPHNALQALLPFKTAVAADVLALPLPPTPNTVSSAAMYSSEVPTRLVDPSVITDSIHIVADVLWASTYYARDLLAQFNNAWLSGSQSIILPSDSKQRYPLWVVTLLVDLAAARAKIDAWEAARCWLGTISKTHPACPALAVECEKAFDSIP